MFAVCAVISGVTTYATIVHQDKQNNHAPNYVDALARSILNAGTFGMVGITAANIGNEKEINSHLNKVVRNSRVSKKVPI